MVNEIDAIIDDLLIRWWQWRPPYQVASGFPSEVPACSLYRASRQYDDENGALDADAEAVQMAGVELCIEALQNPWKLALYEEAQNLVVGAAVWRYNRLPEDPQARAIIVAEARVLFLGNLQDAGLA